MYIYTIFTLVIYRLMGYECVNVCVDIRICIGYQEPENCPFFMCPSTQCHIIVYCLQGWLLFYINTIHCLTCTYVYTSFKKLFKLSTNYLIDTALFIVFFWWTGKFCPLIPEYIRFFLLKTRSLILHILFKSI